MKNPVENLVENPAPMRKLGPMQWLLLAIPCIAVLVVPWFNRLHPSLFGIPFFYWWQMAWVPLSGVAIAIVFRSIAPAGKANRT